MWIPPALQAPAPLPSPAPWWSEKGGLGLEPVGEASFARLGVPYVVEGFHADGRALRRLGLRGKTALWRALSTGQVASGCRLRFLVFLGADKRRAFFEQSLPRFWPDAHFSMARKDVKAFLERVCRPIEPGFQQDYLFLPDRSLWVRMGDEAPVHFPKGPLVEALRRIEWEEDPDTPGTMDRLLQGYAERHP